jgi:enoyl-CoA hydratase
MTYEFIEVERRDRVGVITLNRPKQLNALNPQLMQELGKALHEFDADEAIGAIVLTGNDKAFAAGADIGVMKDYSYMDAFMANYITRDWEDLRRIRKPVIAAVAGYALGGGNEVAMMCDIVIAAENAKFGQPEIKLGVMPGVGGTQRLTRFVGKAKAMEMCLTGRMMDAAEAERSGLVAKVVPADQLIDEAMKTAETIAAMPPLAAVAVKEMVNAAFEIPLAQGIRFERRLFHGLFGTEDQKEGMAAFVEKRPGNWKGR